MAIENQIAICNDNYLRWKQLAFTGDRKAVERAFFWLELQSAFIALHSIESRQPDSRTKEKLIIAKTNLSRKLADYAKEISNELR